MKSSEDLLKEFQKTVTSKYPVDKSPERYASMALFFLKDAVVAIQRNINHPSPENEKKISAQMHLSLKNLAKAATVLDKELPVPKYHPEEMSTLYIAFWDGVHDQFLECMLFSIETHLLFTPKWTLSSLLQASTRMMKKDKK